MIRDKRPGVGFISYYASHDDGGVVKVILVFVDL